MGRKDFLPRLFPARETTRGTAVLLVWDLQAVAKTDVSAGVTAGCGGRGRFSHAARSPTLHRGRERWQSVDDHERFNDPTKCILCAACNTSCPSFWADENFVGPAAIVNAHRFIFDSRDDAADERLEILNDRVCGRGAAVHVSIRKANGYRRRALLFCGVSGVVALDRSQRRWYLYQYSPISYLYGFPNHKVSIHGDRRYNRGAVRGHA